jgi:hypothetical protein
MKRTQGLSSNGLRAISALGMSVGFYDLSQKDTSAQAAGSERFIIQGLQALKSHASVGETPASMPRAPSMHPFRATPVTT